MEVTHLYALIPLLVLLILSMIWYGRGLIHLTGLFYTATLAIMGATNEWEIMFFPLLAITGIIQIILFFWSMNKGSWL